MGVPARRVMSVRGERVSGVSDCSSYPAERTPTYHLELLGYLQERRNPIPVLYAEPRPLAVPLKALAPAVRPRIRVYPQTVYPVLFPVREARHEYALAAYLAELRYAIVEEPPVRVRLEVAVDEAGELRMERRGLQ